MGQREKWERVLLGDESKKNKIKKSKRKWLPSRIPAVCESFFFFTGKEAAFLRSFPKKQEHGQSLACPRPSSSVLSLLVRGLVDWHSLLDTHNQTPAHGGTDRARCSGLTTSTVGTQGRHTWQPSTRTTYPPDSSTCGPHSIKNCGDIRSFWDGLEPFIMYIPIPSIRQRVFISLYTVIQ